MTCKTLSLAIILGIATSVLAMPDFLYNTELARPTAFGLFLAGGVEYFQGDRLYDADGNKTLFSDTGTKSNHILIPVKFGFNLPCSQWSWYFALPILAQNYVAYTGQVTKHDIGMANPFLVGRWIPSLGNGLWLGPRLALRMAGLSKTAINATGDTELASGDNSWGFDAGVLFAYRPEQSSFRLDGQAGIRYLFPATYKLALVGITVFNYKETPAHTFRAELAPGLVWSKNWITYIKGYGTFDISTAKTHDNTSNLDQTHDKVQLYGAGLRQSWEVSPSNELGLEFDYDLAGKATDAGWHLTADYVGYLPM